MGKAVGNYSGVPIAVSGGNAYDSGALLFQAYPFGWKTFQFQLAPGSSTLYSIDVYGTLDLATANGSGGTNWTKLPAPSEQSGVGSAWSNPLTPDTPWLLCVAMLSAVRLVATAGTGSCTVFIAVAP